MSKRQWPMPALPHRKDLRFWELWYNDHLTMIATSRIDPGEVELTQQVWDELPSKVQEGFFKLAILELGAKLEGVGYRARTTWLRLDYGDEGKTSDYKLFTQMRNKYAGR